MYSSVDLNHLSRNDRFKCVEAVVNRAECLADVHSFEAAEHCAHFAFSLCPQDAVALGRVARCCRPELSRNQPLLRASEKVIAAALKIQGLLRVQVLKRINLGSYVCCSCKKPPIVFLICFCLNLLITCAI